MGGWARIFIYIETVNWIPNIVDKLLAKHQVSQWEVEDVLLNFPEYRFVERGRRKDEDVYAALGQTASGRYLMIYFIRKPQNSALVLSARDMEPKERRLYER